jgi:hypothetical protein
MDRDTLQEALDWARDRAVLLGLLAVALAFGCHAWTRRAVSRPPGVLVAEEPVQEDLAPPTTWQAKGHLFTGLAAFDIRARVLSTERYRLDPSAHLSPVDFALGWGAMSDSRVLDKLTITQGGRWFRWAARELPIQEGELMTHAANMHMIPATPAVRAKLLAVREGDVVHLKGKLVKVAGPDGFRWASSLTRSDTGDGSCEVVWVDSISAGPR